MTDFVPPSLQEVWDWKKAAEEETRGMTREQLIEFYRQAGDEFEKQLGLRLPRRPRLTDKTSKGHDRSPQSRS